MTLLTPAQRRQLLANGTAQRAATDQGNALDFYPVVKLFTPDANATWLLTELDPDDPDLAFGLCDLGLELYQSFVGLLLNRLDAVGKPAGGTLGSDRPDPHSIGQFEDPLLHCGPQLRGPHVD